MQKQTQACKYACMPTETTQTDTEAGGHPDAHSHKQTCTTHTQTHTIREHVHSRASPQKKADRHIQGKTQTHSMHKHACTTHTQTDTYKHILWPTQRHGNPHGPTQISTHITHRQAGTGACRLTYTHIPGGGWKRLLWVRSCFLLDCFHSGISLEGCGDLFLNTQCCTVPVQGCYTKHLLDPCALPFLYSSSSHSCSSS